MTDTTPPALEVGTPFLFEGIACEVVDVGGKTGKTITIAPMLGTAAPFDARTLVRGEVIYHDALRVHCHPDRILPSKPRAGAFVARPITGEG